jgi:hypothetical protein
MGLSALIGCGGSTKTVTVGTTAAADTAPLTKADYVKKATAICAKAGPSAAAINRANAAANKADYATATQSLRDALASLRPSVDELNGLPAPAGDEKIIGRLNTLRTQALALYERLADAFHDADAARAQGLITELISVTDQASGIATGYGLAGCR